ncbi:MAG: substrate-binding domain-containing protein [Victivallales bacterium]|nr:substrate-binding domain-containing protein [Victivallales bacterium]
MMRAKELRKILFAMIKNGELMPGDDIGSAKELAERYQTPLISVNRIMAQLHREGIVRRVKGHGTFVAEDACRKLALRIGFFTSYSRMSMSPRQFSGFGIWYSYVIDVLKRRGDIPVLLELEDLKNPDLGKVKQLDGLLLAASVDDDMLNALSGQELSVVQILDATPGFHSFYQVIPDLSAGFTSAAQLIKKSGICKVGVVIRGAVEAHEKRGAAIIETLVRSGFSQSNITVHRLPVIVGDHGEISAYNFAAQEFKCARPDEVFLCSSDYLAIGIVSWCLSGKLRPGEDIKLIGFDNLEGEGYTPFGAPFLTTVDFPRKEIMDQAIVLLVRAIRREAGFPGIIKVPTRVIVRNSFPGI